MRNFFRNTMGAIVAGLFVLAAFATTITPIAAQTPLGSRSFTARLFPTQQTHYMRFVLNFNSCPIPAGAATCNVKVGALPYNAFLTTIHKQIITVFNPTTSATWSLGTNTTGTNIMAAFNVFTGQSTAAVTDTSFAGAGELITGATAAQTGTLGGFDVYAVYTTGANGSQGTTGTVVFIIEYIAPNDGTCTQVPLGATAAAC